MALGVLVCILYPTCAWISRRSAWLVLDDVFLGHVTRESSFAMAVKKGVMSFRKENISRGTGLTSQNIATRGMDTYLLVSEAISSSWMG